MPLGAAPSTSAATSSRPSEIFAHRPHRFALADDDVRLHSRFVEDFADRRADHALDAQPLLLLDRLLHPAELDEVLRLDDSDTSILPLVLAARRAAKRSATRASALSSTTTRYVRLASAPMSNVCCGNPRQVQAAAQSFGADLTATRRIGFEPREPFGHASMPIELKMPALSPTMEEGTLAKWLVKEGDEVKSGDILAEIETDKATMEFEAVDEGKIAKILVPEGTDGVKVGAAIAIMAGRAKMRRGGERGAQGGQTPGAAAQGKGAPKPDEPGGAAPPAPAETPPAPATSSRPAHRQPARAARRGATGSKPRRSREACAGAEHRSVGSRAAAPAAGSSAPMSSCGRQGAGCRAGSGRRAAPAGAGHRHARADGTGDPARRGEALQHPQDHRRRLTESKQQIPHIYLTIDIQLDALLKLRGELNKGLETAA